MRPPPRGCRARWPENDLARGTQDPGLYIKRVVFQLHPSFNPATRVVEKAPFEVTEQGWGEFEVRTAPSGVQSSPVCAPAPAWPVAPAGIAAAPCPAPAGASQGLLPRVWRPRRRVRPPAQALPRP
eukprot:scaffold2600_cov103-Isochrysis_galbana.AAC.13